MRKKHLFLTLSAGILLTGMSSASAQTSVTVFSENFEDGQWQGGDRANQWYTVRYNDGGSGFVTASTTIETTSSASAISGNHSFRLGHTSNGNIGAIAGFNSVTLQQGESLNLSFSFSGEAYSANNSNRFRFGLLNDNGNPLTSDNNTAANGYWGYMGQTPFHSSTIGDTSNIISFEGNGAFPRQTFNGLATEEGFNLLPETLGDHMQFTQSITRNALDGLDIVVTFTNLDNPDQFLSITTTVDAANLIGGEDAYTFNAIGFGNHQSRPITFLMDDVLVTHVIPEPAHFAMMFGGLAVLFAFIRRRRKS